MGFLAYQTTYVGHKFKFYQRVGAGDAGLVLVKRFEMENGTRFACATRSAGRIIPLGSCHAASFFMCVAQASVSRPSPGSRLACSMCVVHEATVLPSCLTCVARGGV